MKKALLIIIPIALILCIIGAVATYFIWQSIQKGNTLTGGSTPSVTITPEVTDTSTNTNNPSNTSETGVCALLTLDIAKQILGNDAKLASQSSGNCTYSSTSDLGGFGVLTIVVTQSSVLTAKAQFEEARVSVYDNDTDPVTGLNVDEAYFANKMLQLSILKGDSWIIISGTSDKYTSEKDMAVATAKLVF